ncbi:DUF1223 domain-containing protein [Erythrobacter sp. W53]|uniref:DUF1223 domain-containing protein n=1 Tax=Erythrobacter sp. W53 TaxID=3425947 RepID=UPI003D769EC0
MSYLPPIIPATILGTLATVGVFLTFGAPSTALMAGPILVETPETPVAIELFTSQGCSSCPPADRVAAKLAKEENLVVISRPVTYWDRLGWKDTLAREENTKLQRDYAFQGLSGRNGVYTPQVVVDGQRGTVGSNEAIVRQYIKQSAKAPAALALRPQDDGSVIIGVAGDTSKAAHLTLVALDSHVSVKIGRGENGGRTVNYTNVVVDETRLGEWNGGKASFTITPNQLSHIGADRYALLLRSKNAGPILAARYVVRGEENGAS